jgi:ATP-dependent exoDNAse (exonuclease V) alpha subunit
MVGVPLMRAVFCALPTRVALLLVGDVDQLSSVWPGQVLATWASPGPMARSLRTPSLASTPATEIEVATAGSGFAGFLRRGCQLVATTENNQIAIPVSLLL